MYKLFLALAIIGYVASAKLDHLEYLPPNSRPVAKGPYDQGLSAPSSNPNLPSQLSQGSTLFTKSPSSGAYGTQSKPFGISGTTGAFGTGSQGVSKGQASTSFTKTNSPGSDYDIFSQNNRPSDQIQSSQPSGPFGTNPQAFSSSQSTPVMPGSNFGGFSKNYQPKFQSQSSGGFGSSQPTSKSSEKPGALSISNYESPTRQHNQPSGPQPTTYGNQRPLAQSGPYKSSPSGSVQGFKPSQAPSSTEYSSQNSFGSLNQVPIIHQDTKNFGDGTYTSSFLTGNGISAEEKGESSGDTSKAEGSFSYTSPDGQQIGVKYIADENGYQPQGEHLPTPPPIPAAILKSLEYNQAHPEEENEGLSESSGQYQPSGGASNQYVPPSNSGKFSSASSPFAQQPNKANTFGSSSIKPSPPSSFPSLNRNPQGPQINQFGGKSSQNQESVGKEKSQLNNKPSGYSTSSFSGKPSPSSSFTSQQEASSLPSSSGSPSYQQPDTDFNGYQSNGPSTISGSQTPSTSLPGQTGPSSFKSVQSAQTSGQYGAPKPASYSASKHQGTGIFGNVASNNQGNDVPQESSGSPAFITGNSHESGQYQPSTGHQTSQYPETSQSRSPASNSVGFHQSGKVTSQHQVPSGSGYQSSQFSSTGQSGSPTSAGSYQSDQINQVPTTFPGTGSSYQSPQHSYSVGQPGQGSGQNQVPSGSHGTNFEHPSSQFPRTSQSGAPSSKHTSVYQSGQGVGQYQPSGSLQGTGSGYQSSQFSSTGQSGAPTSNHIQSGQVQSSKSFQTGFGVQASSAGPARASVSSPVGSHQSGQSFGQYQAPKPFPGSFQGQKPFPGSFSSSVSGQDQSVGQKKQQPSGFSAPYQYNPPRTPFDGSSTPSNGRKGDGVGSGTGVQAQDENGGYLY